MQSPRRGFWIASSLRLLATTHPDHASVIAVRCIGQESNPRPIAYEAMALPLSYRCNLVRVAGFDPAASCVRGKRSSRLSYTLAPRRSFDLLSHDRQSCRLTRCVTGQEHDPEKLQTFRTRSCSRINEMRARCE